MSVQKSISSLLPYLILCIVVGSARSSGKRDDCSSSCGSQSISHPFRLRSDPPTCGLPKSVREIKIVDANLVSGQCKLPFLFPSRSVIRGGAFEVLSPYWASFVKCSNKVQVDTYQAVPCLSGNNTFVYLINDYRVGALLPSCRFLSMVPTFYSRDGASSEAEVFQSLKEGFSLEVLDSRFSLAIFLVGTICSLSAASILLVIALLVRFLVAPLSIFVFLAYECRKLMVPIDSVEKFLRNQQILATTRYAYADLIAMTRHFKEKLGQGGFGSVYKGELPGGNFIAIKMLGNSKCNGDEFINEVSTIGRIHHLNVVRLVGFCAEGSYRALVYEFMPNGSLDKYIFSSNGMHQQFTKEKLNEIALGVARGIDYLHRGCDMRILHFDIKPHNILLDHNFNPKVSDFGLAKLYSRDYSLVSISVARGTIGYMAPELVSRSFGVISHKSDVYSFGMLLMEMAGGRRNVNQRAENSSQVYYPSWIYDRLLQIEGPKICNSIEIDDMERKLCKVGLWCIQMRPSDRPSMSRVIEMLEADVHTLQMPPKPFLSTSGPVSIREIYLHSSSELLTISEDE